MELVEVDKELLKQVISNASKQMKEVGYEMKSCFDKWDDAVSHNRQPVPIQDLDYWGFVMRTQSKLLDTCLNRIL